MSYLDKLPNPFCELGAPAPATRHPAALRMSDGTVIETSVLRFDPPPPKPPRKPRKPRK